MAANSREGIRAIPDLQHVGREALAYSSCKTRPPVRSDGFHRLTLMEIRHNIITGEPVIVAPERAARPNTFTRIAELDLHGRSPSPDFSEPCPFCPGNEAGTPAEVSRKGDPWQVRVFPNKYPFAPQHEVIVESADHYATFEQLPHAPDVVATYLERTRELSRRPGVEHAVFFKNNGRMAGASLQHLHSQVAGVTFTPPRVLREAAAFRRSTDCPLCSRALDNGALDRNDSFALIRPHSRSFAAELWVMPLTHRNDLTNIPAGEIDDFAALLQLGSRRIAKASSDHNWLLMSFPEESSGHAYLQLIPRTTVVAGFELASGTFIDSGTL